MWCYVGQMFQLCSCSCCVLIVHIFTISHPCRPHPTNTDKQSKCLLQTWYSYTNHFSVVLRINFNITHVHALAFHWFQLFSLFFSRKLKIVLILNKCDREQWNAFIHLLPLPMMFVLMFECQLCIKLNDNICSHCIAVSNWISMFILNDLTIFHPIIRIIIVSYCQQPCSEKKLIHNNAFCNNSWNRRMSASAPSHGCERMKLLFVFDF